MIITCEQCNARYLLASLLLGATGRTVRCGVCGHTWYQDAVEEPLTREAADTVSFDDMVRDSIEAIPEGVKPIPEGSNVPVLNTALKKPFPTGILAGAVAAGLVLVLIGGAIFGLRQPIVRSWPPAALLYEMAGIHIPVPGEGLIFDQIRAQVSKAEGGEAVLSVTGNIVNLRTQDAVIPDIRATLLDKAAVAGPSWGLHSAQATLEGEGTIPFTMTYQNLPDDMTEVNIRFVP